MIYWLIMVNLHRLSILLRVIDLESVTQAAEELRYTPSAVSQQLKKLEKEIGQPLLRRHSRGVVPTDAGRVLATHARKVFTQLDAAQVDLTEVAEGRNGTLVIGSFPTLAASFLPRVIETFTHERPEVHLKVRSARFEGLIEDLQRGKTHMALIWDYPWEPVSADVVQTEELYEEESVVIVAKDHPFAGRGEVPLEEFRDEPWIVRAGNHPAMGVLERAATSARFRPSVAMYVNDYQEAQAMVSVGMGVLMVPRSALALKHPDVRVISLGADAPIRRVLLARREEHECSPAERTFISVLKELIVTEGTDAGSPG